MFEPIRSFRRSIVYDRAGNVILDTPAIIADGYSVSVPLMFQDKAGNVIPDPMNTGKPELVAREQEFQRQQEARARAEAAYLMRKASLSQSWMKKSDDKNFFW